MVKKKKELLKLDFGYGDREKLLKFPWRWENDSVEDFKCAEVFQYVPAKLRLKFMEELYRVLVASTEAKAVLLTSYYSSASAIADYEVEWPPINEQSFLFFNKQWREDNNIPSSIKCDFDYGYGFVWAADVASRNPETQAEFSKSRLNVIHKLQVVLTKKV